LPRKRESWHHPPLSHQAKTGRLAKEIDMVLLTNPDAIITFTVGRFLSVTQGTMVTSGASPDVTSALVQGGGRVSRLNNNSFEVAGGNPQGNNPLVLQFEVLPADKYAAVGLIIKNLHNVSEGGVTSWDSVNVGSGVNDNKVTVTDRVPLPAGTASITYEVYMLVRPKQAVDGFPIGDVGLIDPLFTNR
jgi:hypothetical protein